MFVIEETWHVSRITAMLTYMILSVCYITEQLRKNHRKQKLSGIHYSTALPVESVGRWTTLTGVEGATRAQW